MIERIGSNYDYKPQKLNKKVRSDTETFSMDYARQDKTRRIDKEEKEQKEDSAIEMLLRKQQEADGGVKVELSKEASARTVKEESSDNTESMTSFIRERFKNLWTDIKAAFVKFFGGVERVAEEDITVVDTMEALEEEEEAFKEPPKTQAQMREELLASLYENGEKRLAKNSDLLTTYNKRGSFVQMNAGDKNRILHMHPNQIDETF